MIAIVASRLIPVSSSPLTDHPVCCHEESYNRRMSSQRPFPYLAGLRRDPNIAAKPLLQAASRMSQLRKSSSAASQFPKKLTILKTERSRCAQKEFFVGFSNPG